MKTGKTNAANPEDRGLLLSGLRLAAGEWE